VVEHTRLEDLQAGVPAVRVLVARFGGCQARVLQHDVMRDWGQLPEPDDDWLTLADEALALIRAG
jgi:hypothetical protein